MFSVDGKVGGEWKNYIQVNHIPNKTQTILVTGSAGFIGSNLVLRLLESKEPLNIVGLDNLNDYYDPSLKEYRLRLIDEKVLLHPEHSYRFVKGDLAD